jgi:energy-coupling factor transport system permease protein
VTGFVDLYTSGNTFLHHMDPRVKIASVIIVSILAFVLSSLASLAVLLAVILAMVLLSRTPLAKTAFAFKFVFRLMILIIVLWPLFDRSGEPVLTTLGPITLTEPAVIRGITSATRIGCLATIWYILMFTTQQRDIVRALVKLGVRFDIGLTLAISLRFFPTFSATIGSIMDAQRARGLEFGKGNLIKRTRNYVSVLIPAIVSAMRTADGLSLALQSRGYGARMDRTYLRDFRMKWADYVALTTIVLVFVLPLAAKYAFGISL